MKTPLAWLNLVHQKTRTLVAVAGVAFAVILIFMQMGFKGMVLDSANLLYGKLNFDVAMMSPEYLHSGVTSSFRRERLELARSIQGVQSVAPLYIGFNRWINPEEKPDPCSVGKSKAMKRQRRHIMILGFRIADQLSDPDPGEHVFQLNKMDVTDGGQHNNGLDIVLQLKVPGTVLMDTLSHKDFGPQKPHTMMEHNEVGARKVQIVGNYTMGGGLGADGTIITSDETFAQIFPGWSLDTISLGLIKVNTDETDPDSVAAALKKILPADVKVQTREQLEAAEKRHWEKSTPIGIIFGMGVWVALIVGIVFVYQVISSDIANHLSEFATLKAMGYGNRYLNSVVLQQAILLAVLGYVPGLIIASILYQVTEGATNLPIHMDLMRDAKVLVLAIVMCALSGFLSLRKLRAADPADLF